MEATKEQGAAVFGTAEMESQRTAPKKRNNRKNIVIVVGFNSHVSTSTRIIATFSSLQSRIFFSSLNENTISHYFLFVTLVLYIGAVMT